MFSEVKVTEIYCMADDFCKEFAKVQGKYMVENKNHKHRNKPNWMSDAEIMVLLFHPGGGAGASSITTRSMSASI